MEYAGESDTDASKAEFRCRLGSVKSDRNGLHKSQRNALKRHMRLHVVLGGDIAGAHRFAHDSSLEIRIEPVLFCTGLHCVGTENT